MDKSQFVKEAHANLRGRMDELFNMAEDIGKRHFDFVMAENKKRGWDEKSILFVKSRLRENTLAVTWYEVHWYGSKELKTRRMKKKVIVKPRHKYGYNMDTLFKQAQPWEVSMVSEVENDLIPLRREAVRLSVALAQLNQVLKAASSEESE